MDGNSFKRKILSQMRVKLGEEFDRNFERKAFFSERWKQRAKPSYKGSLLLVTGTMRRSIKGEVRGYGVRFTSAVPYAVVHNEGGEIVQQVRSHSRKSRKGKSYTVKSHTRRMTMPKRQFVGGGKETGRIIRTIITKNLKEYVKAMNRQFKKLQQ